MCYLAHNQLAGYNYYKKYSIICIDIAHFMERPKYGTSHVPSGLHTGCGTCTSIYGTSIKIRDVWQPYSPHGVPTHPSSVQWSLTTCTPWLSAIWMRQYGDLNVGESGYGHKTGKGFNTNATLRMCDTLHDVYPYVRRSLTREKSSRETLMLGNRALYSAGIGEPQE